LTRRLAPALTILFFAIVSVVPLWKAVFAGQAIGPFDQIRHMPPGNGPVPSQPWDVLQVDGVLQFYPWRHMVFDAWSKGQLPLWNPFQLAGAPLLANSQSAGFYPPHILLGLLHAPTALGMTLLAWFHLFWAGLGTYLLARKLGAGRLGAMVAGSSFALSPFMLDWTALPSTITTIAWIPWAMAMTASIHRAGSSSPLRAGLGLALSVGMMFLAGHLQFAAYGLLSVVFLSIWLGVANRSTKGRWALCAAGVVLGAFISAPQLLPVLQFSKHSHRQNTATAEGYGKYVAGAIQPFELANLAIPYALGSPREVGATLPGDQTISAYWPMWVKPGANLAESAITIGPLVLGLLLVVPWRNRRLWPLMGLGVLALLLAMGTPLNALLYFLVPKWSSTGSPNRVVFVFVLCASVLAAFGVDEAIERRAKPKKLIALIAPLVIGGALALVGPSLAPDPGPAAEIVSALKGTASGSATITLLVSCLLAAIGLALWLFPEAAKYRKAVVVFPVVLAWLGYASNLTPTGEPAPIGNGSSLERAAMVNSDWGIQTSTKALAPPNTPSLAGVYDLAGYDSLLDVDTVNMLRDIDGEDPAAKANGNLMFVKPGFDASKLAAAGVTSVYSIKPLAQLTQAEDQGGYLLYRLPGPGRISAEGGSATIAEDGYDHQVLNVSPGTKSVTLRDRAMEGWHVEGVGDIPVGMWRQFQPPQGGGKLLLTYTPPGLKAGLILGAIGWLAMLLGVLQLARVKRSASHSAGDPVKI
jgi:hypothetical protein